LSQPERGPDGEPVFGAPWEAEAFALTVSLNERGLFTWVEWAECLGAEIGSDPGRPYYEHWLSALEKLVERKNAMSRAERLIRIEAWREAVRRTPHGQAIELVAAATPDGGR
jgi:nitrile hydratase accessory protein